MEQAGSPRPPRAARMRKNRERAWKSTQVCGSTMSMVRLKNVVACCMPVSVE